MSEESERANNSLKPWRTTPAHNAGPVAGPSADPAGWGSIGSCVARSGTVE